jgi:3-oxoacyl-(acyl-carrier-protein) synthase
MLELNMSGMKKRRVAITGMGAVTPVGNSLQETWNGIIEGKRVADPTKKFDASKFPTKFCYEVSGFELDRSLIDPEDEKFLNLAGEYGVNAASEALNQAGLIGSNVDRDRMSVCLGVGMFSPSFDWYSKVMLPEKWEDPSLKEHIMFWPNPFSEVVAKMSGAQGGVTTIHTACASSGQSLGEAYELIAYGDSDVCITGGTDSMINPFHTAGFNLLGALSKRNDDPMTASRPFDEDRDGFVLGEGACMLVFEEWDHAVARGAKILGEVCGYGITESAYRITDLHPEGTGPREAMQMAVDDAGVTADKVGYVNAHGTSTHLNDKCETLAVSQVFTPDVHVSSTKSMTGHLISAAGAIEFAVCVKALEHQVLPPSANLFNKDPAVPTKICPDVPTEKSMEYALSNSVGFGGSNTALLARRVSK